MAVPGSILPLWSILGSASWSSVVLTLRFFTNFLSDSIFKKREYFSIFIEIIAFLFTSVMELSSALSFLDFFLPVRNSDSASFGQFSSAVSSEFSQMSLSLIFWVLICKSILCRTPVNCLCLPRYSHSPLHHSN